ncbi:MAG: proline dehydrogenase family protein [Bacteroidetes bacterium]|nr:proline dehydrogenase family protein [Bacteroidota bacterium]
MISFDNTEIAFSAKKNADLNRSFWLFNMVSRPWMVNLGKVLTEWSLAINLPIKSAVKATIFKQFCGGETIEDCNKTIAELGNFNIGTILDYSVEGKESDDDFNASTREIIATISRAKGEKNIPFSVFKVTGVAPLALLEKVSAKIPLTKAEEIDFAKVHQRVKNICEAAYNAGVPLFIDAEETWIQPAIDDLANEMMEKYNTQKAVVYNTYQLYRKDRLAYLKESFEKARQKNYYIGAKLVRGAYMEKERERALEKGYPSPIQDTKEATDKDYDAAVEFCILNRETISLCAGTHNENSSLRLVELIEASKIAKNDKHIYFSQLLGMSDHISYNLSKAGYNVAKYVPYGPIKEVLPYLIRRAQENTSVKGQTGRELSLIIKERRRRNGK